MDRIAEAIARDARILRLREHPEWTSRAAKWFHEKWNIPEEAYLESIRESQSGNAPVPNWYIVPDADAIVAGIGVIANDFHDRKELTPNVCALYVERAYRNRGVAGALLEHVCAECAQDGIRTVYLITDHTAFYERYGWTFLCMVQGDGEAQMTRLYRRAIPATAKTSGNE